MNVENFNTLATWYEELAHLKRPWCWEWLKAGGEGDDRGWDGWMASLTQWTWVWVSSGSWWWTRKPSILQSVGSQRVRHNWITELNWTVGRGLSWLAPKKEICVLKGLRWLCFYWFKADSKKDWRIKVCEEDLKLYYYIFELNYLEVCLKKYYLSKT